MDKTQEISTILILQGGPATGKTTLGKKIAADLKLPYFSKDGIKEPIFDFVGCPTTPAILDKFSNGPSIDYDSGDPLSGMKMEKASVAILFRLIEAHIRVGKSCVIDCTFGEVHESAFRELQSDCFFYPIQVYCHADAVELSRRYRQRAESGERHPGHFDHLLYESFSRNPSGWDLPPLEIGGAVFSIDTTNSTAHDYDQLLQSIRKEISNSSNEP
mgnify:FL=1